jgi:hypothetical protein
MQGEIWKVSRGRWTSLDPYLVVAECLMTAQPREEGDLDWQFCNRRPVYAHSFLGLKRSTANTIQPVPARESLWTFTENTWQVKVLSFPARPENSPPPNRHWVALAQWALSSQKLCFSAWIWDSASLSQDKPTTEGKGKGNPATANIWPKTHSHRGKPIKVKCLLERIFCSSETLDYLPLFQERNRVFQF